MRTRSNVFYGEGTADFIKKLTNFYAAGNVNVVYDDRERAENFCRELTAAGFKADLRPFVKADFPDRGFTVGIGGEGVIRAVKRCAREKYAFYPSFVCAELFTCFGGNFAEFSFIDVNDYNCGNRRAVAECHCALLTAFTDGLACYYGDLAQPFRDKGLYCVLKSATGILTGLADREEFIREALNACMRIVDILHARGADTLTAAETARRMGGGLSNRYSAAYFLNRLLILFTKWNFRDILITAERPINNVSQEAFPGYGADDLLLDVATLAKIVGYFREYTEKAELSALIKAFAPDGNGGNQTFARIYNRGITEGLINYG